LRGFGAPVEWEGAVLLEGGAMRGALTVVEMLVVVIIIVIVAVLLVPVFEETRGKAYEAKCAAHVRQIGVAMDLYRNAYGEAWPWARRSVHPDHSDWPDPTASLAAIYPAYAPKAYLFRCPAVDDVVTLEEDGTDFLNCGNFHVPPRDPVTGTAHPDSPRPPSYFFDGGSPGGVNIPINASPMRVACGDECPHWVPADTPELAGSIGTGNHVGGGNFLFVDQHVEWLRVSRQGGVGGVPRVLNRRVADEPQVRSSGLAGDACVFGNSSGRVPDQCDADLAGMVWTGSGWSER
jgi:type II secretory pathway pseudopilin PulG